MQELFRARLGEPHTNDSDFVLEGRSHAIGPIQHSPLPQSLDHAIIACVYRSLQNLTLRGIIVLYFIGLLRHGT